MVKIEITDNSMIINGHTENKICSVITILSQYICSNLEPLISYYTEYGYLKAEFLQTKLSEQLLTTFVKIIRDMNYTGIYLIDNRKIKE